MSLGEPVICTPVESTTTGEIQLAGTCSECDRWLGPDGTCPLHGVAP